MSVHAHDLESSEPGPPRVLCAEDLDVDGQPLQALLRGAGYEPIMVELGHRPAQAIADLPRAPDLLILPFRGLDEEFLEEVRAVRGSLRLRPVPILGVGRLGPGGLDVRLFRSHGVVGLVDPGAGAEIVLHRVEEIVSAVGRRRVHERAACFLPVEVDGGNEEYALDLSVGGMRMTSLDPLEPNTDLRLRFRLPLLAEPVEASARVVHRAPWRNSGGRYEVGLFFYPLRREHRQAIEREVTRLLCG